MSNNPKKYSELLESIGELWEKARKQAYTEINVLLVLAYWEIGRKIVEYEQKGKEKAAYGGRILENISIDLTREYGGGFSRDNLEKMRRLYIIFPNSATLSRKLSWSHYCLLLRLKEDLARSFYLLETEKEGWSVRELDRQINSLLFERVALHKNKEEVLELAEKGQQARNAQEVVKDPYVFEFLGLEQIDSETELEEKIITHLKRFLLEMGKGFMFVSRQQKITIEDEHFYTDLVLYHRQLRCFVIIELKIGKLTHQDLGQLQMYVHYYDRTVRQLGENPTIGILLCADKKEAIVKYTLPEDNKQIFASQYRLYLPDKKELAGRLKKILQKEEKKQ